MITQNDKTVILSSKLFNSCSRWAQWWDEVISKWKVIFIIANNYCYLHVSRLLQWGHDVSRAVLQRHQAAWNTLLPFCIKHSHSQNMATNVSNCSPKITRKKTKGHKLLFGVHWTGKKGLPKMRNAPLHKNLLAPLQRGFTATITLRIINLFTFQPNFLETFCTL